MKDGQLLWSTSLYQTRSTTYIARWSL